MGPVGLRIDNRTDYRTDDLRRVFAAGMREIGLSYRRKIEVVYSRKSEVNGMATYPVKGVVDWMWFSLPRKRLSVRQLAQVFEHEAQHNQGLKHQDMAISWFDLKPTWHRGLKIRYRKQKRHKGKR